MADVAIRDLPSASSVEAGNLFVISQSSTTKKATLEVLKEYIEANLTTVGRWSLVSTSNYTTTPATTSRITCSDTSPFSVGLPLKYTYGGTTYYGIVSAVLTDSYIDIVGAPLNTGSALTALYVGTPEMLFPVDFFIPSTYGASTGDKLASMADTYFRWNLPKANLVHFQAIQKKADSGGSQPKVNVKIEGYKVSNYDSSNGIQLSDYGSWVSNPDVSIDTTRYEIERGEDVEITCTAAGSTGDAEDLTISCLFVMQ